MKLPKNSTRSLLALILALAMVLALSACGGKPASGDGSAAQQEPNFVLDNGEDGTITVTAKEAGEGSGGMGYLTMGEGQTMVVETALEGDSALRLQVNPGEGTHAENPPEADTSADYLLDETVSGSKTYTFDLDAGEYTVLVTAVGTTTGTARIYADVEAAESAYDKAMAAYQSVLDEHPDAYYAFADMAEDQDILLLSTADDVFRPEEAYNAVTATVYCVDETGAPKELGTVESGGTANPLSAVDGHLFFGGHKEMYKVHVDTATGTLVYDAGAQIRYDAEENATYYEGTDPDSMTEAQDSSAFDALLEEYGNAVPVEFRPVTEGGAEGSEGSEASMPNPVMQVDEAQQLELTGVVLNAPEGAEDVSRTVILEDEHPIATVSFTYEGRTYDYRCQSTGEFEPVDITGLYFDWTDEQKGEVQGREAIIRTCDEAGCILWLDVAPGFTYSLSCSGGVDADTLSSVANLVFEELQGDA